MWRVAGLFVTALRRLGHFCFVRPGVSRPADQKGFRPGSGEPVEADLLALDRCTCISDPIKRRGRLPFRDDGDLPFASMGTKGAF
jgi:hypothetical protein